MRPVVIDTREQRPYSFAGSVHKALPAGDYSLEGLETVVAIERKSLEDWVNTLLRGKERFRKELTKLQSYAFAAVVIEGSVPDILAGDYKSNLAPAALLGMTTAVMIAYHPVHIIFANDRPHAYALVDELLKLADKHYGNIQI
jgi:DNA excision repair protein ERCC-4